MTVRRTTAVFRDRNYWRSRAEAAEASLAKVSQALDEASEHLAGVQHRFEEQAILISIVRDGRINRFNFTRNRQLYSIETMGIWDDDVEGWKRDLLTPKEG